MEHRIGALKRSITNLGPNFDQEHVQLVNKTIEIKEKLYHETRKAHGVRIRCGRHVPRPDTNDYKAILKCLDETEAHVIIPGRRFGDYSLSADITRDKRFDRASFLRWLTTKNREAISIFQVSQPAS